LPGQAGQAVDDDEVHLAAAHGREERLQTGALGLRVVARPADVLVVVDELPAASGDERGGGLTLRRRLVSGVVLAGLELMAVGSRGRRLLLEAGGQKEIAMIIANVGVLLLRRRPTATRPAQMLKPPVPESGMLCPWSIPNSTL
jgi:hypothetical protein